MKEKNKNNIIENDFKALYELMADPVVIIERTGKLLAANCQLNRNLKMEVKKIG
jgi:hypothetical protein